MATRRDPESFAAGLVEGLREAVAWKRGKLALETRNVRPMAPERIKAIRRSVAGSQAEFERRFGIPAGTMRNWEQGRRSPDPASRLLLRLIEREPEAVERVAKEMEAA